MRFFILMLGFVILCYSQIFPVCSFLVGLVYEQQLILMLMLILIGPAILFELKVLEAGVRKDDNLAPGPELPLISDDMI